MQHRFSTPAGTWSWSGQLTFTEAVSTWAPQPTMSADDTDLIKSELCHSETLDNQEESPSVCWCFEYSYVCESVLTCTQVDCSLGELIIVFCYVITFTSSSFSCVCSLPRMTGFGIQNSFVHTTTIQEEQHATTSQTFYKSSNIVLLITFLSCLTLCPLVRMMGRRLSFFMFMLFTALTSLLQLGIPTCEYFIKYMKFCINVRRHSTLKQF